MNATATVKKTRTNSATIEPIVSTGELIQSAFAEDKKLAQATEKLQKLHAEMNEVQRQANLLAKSRCDVPAMAAAILEGTDLVEHEAVATKLTMLQKRLDAYRQAIETQKLFVDSRRAVACEFVVSAVAPIHAANCDRLKQAIDQLEAAANSFAELQSVLSASHVRNNLSFAGLQQITGHVKQLVALASSIG